MPRNKTKLYGALVWLISAVVIFAYLSLMLFGYKIPGIEELSKLMANVEGKYMYLAGFAAIFFEGLYIVGIFAPGVTLVLLLGALSQIAGITQFIFTVLAIFIGWVLAGVVNIVIASWFQPHVSKDLLKEEYKVQDRPWLTWLPAFRANYEVAQISEGASVSEVFFSSLRVKIYATIVAAVSIFSISFFINIQNISNEEGFLSLAAVGFVMLVVGILKLRDSTEGK